MSEEHISDMRNLEEKVWHWEGGKEEINCRGTIREWPKYNKDD